MRDQDTQQDLEQGPSTGHSVPRSALHSAARRSSDHAVLEDADEVRLSSTPPDVSSRIAEHRRRSSTRDENIFAREPNLATSPTSTGYGTTYGSLASHINEPAQRHAGRLFAEQQATGTTAPDKEREPLLTKRVSTPHGGSVNVVVGQSTLPQTIFNSVNVLVGVGMLSLPLAVRYGGWLIGLSFFFASALVTSYTAKLLAKCIDVDKSLVTFADIAYVSFGQRARIIVSLLFTLELMAACVALVILFADSVDLLIVGWGTLTWKIVCGLILIPLNFVPMRNLSFTSILGILCCVLIVVVVFADGIIKRHALGSLHEPAETYLFPRDWRTLPLAFGLLMAPWGGHSVFPNIYRDMRHPLKYTKAVSITYIFTCFLESALAIAGYLMFGEKVRDEISANIFRTKGYPRWLSILMVAAIAIVPLAKVPLNSRPIISTLEIFLGLDARSMPGSSTLSGMSNLSRGILRIAIRVSVPVILVLLAIAVPSFDRVMSLLGSLACFSICIILPCAFHLKMFGKDVSMAQRTLDWTLIVVSSVLGIAGTICAFLPKEMLGAEQSKA